MGFKALAVAVGTTDTVLFECPATYDGSAHGIVFGNVTASAVTITIKLYDHSEGGSKTLIAGKSIAANSEYTFPKPINLNAGDKIIALASSASAVTALVSAYIATAAPAAVGITPRGDYSSTAQYAVNDAVYDPATETTYLALAANTASPPPSANWMVLAKRGDTGAPGSDGVGVTVSGNLSLYVTQTTTLTITNYDSATTYTVSVTGGAVSQTGDQITYTAGSTAGSFALSITAGGATRSIPITVNPAAVVAPTITSPSAGQTGITETPTITTSAFSAIGLSDTHLNTDWEIRTAANGGGTLIASSMASSTNKTIWTVSAGLLSVSTTYYVRARHRGTTLGASAWGESSFTTAATFNSYIPTPTATPTSFGDALEGGFYAGMVWNQIAQSSSSKTLATGTQTFTVPDMTSAPIVYAGQTIEVRSRANPTNKFVGTVTGATGTTLTLNVTSIGGSGTFSDWSVMARFRVIVAPKSSGENAGVALKNSNDAFPTACQTLVDGFASTEAMKNAGTSTVYPAAHWARGLSIGGKTDWYIPARDELELCWRNLKPVTNNNYVTADRPTGQSFDYKRDGSYGDTANTHGTNNNSSPTGAAYTVSVPGQTAATPFRSGGSEAFEFGSVVYWSSSEYSASLAWSQYWYSSYPGNQINYDKASASRVRAVRRSII